MGELIKRFLEKYVPVRSKPGTQEVYRSALENYVIPRPGNRRVAEIERGDMVALHHELRATPYQANRTIQVLSRIFTLKPRFGTCVQTAPDPCRHVKRLLSDEEYRRLGAALKESEEQGLEPPSAVAAIRLLMLTGCRKSEILTLRWEYVDLEAGELRLPDLKTGPRSCIWPTPPHRGTARHPQAGEQSFGHLWKQVRQSPERSKLLLAAYPQAGRS